MNGGQEVNSCRKQHGWLLGVSYSVSSLSGFRRGSLTVLVCQCCIMYNVKKENCCTPYPQTKTFVPQLLGWCFDDQTLTLTSLSKLVCPLCLCHCQSESHFTREWLQNVTSTPGLSKLFYFRFSFFTYCRHGRNYLAGVTAWVTQPGKVTEWCCHHEVDREIAFWTCVMY